ncbi:MAG: hypothetical protein IT233_12590 [Bacteroidia bacterium]|nr:hypothetical protein [Bacteroidia bacterium]
MKFKAQHSDPKQETGNKDSSGWKEIVLVSALGLVVAGGTILLVSRVIKSSIANTEEKKSLETNAPASYAKQIKLAFENDGWWGTDEEALRSVLRRIPTKSFFKEVAASYKKLYGDPITKEMQDELTSGEYEEMMMIISSKPEMPGDTAVLNHLAWAKRLHAAVNISYGIFPGTDEDAIKAVFLEIPTRADFSKVMAVYEKEYAVSLLADIKEDLSSSDLNAMLQIISKKP